MESHSPILVGLAFATIVVALTAFGRRLPVPAPVQRRAAWIQRRRHCHLHGR
jgi:hypothetical protein